MPADPKRRCNRCKAISLTAELADEGRTWVADVCAQCGARWFNDPPLAASDIPPADPLTPEAAALGLTPEVVEELERLHRRATPPPWKKDVGYEQPTSITVDGDEGLCIAETEPVGPDYVYDDGERTANLELMIALRNHAPALLATARSALAAEARGREQARAAVCGFGCAPDARLPCVTCARIRALAPAAPKAAPPADALRDVVARFREYADRNRRFADSKKCENARKPAHQLVAQQWGNAADELEAALARSAPPAPAAPVCSAEEK